MIRKLIQWSLDNVLIVLMLAVALASIGVYSFMHINVEAYPDPAPPTVEVVAQFSARPPRRWNARSPFPWK